MMLLDYLTAGLYIKTNTYIQRYIMTMCMENCSRTSRRPSYSDWMAKRSEQTGQQPESFKAFLIVSLLLLLSVVSISLILSAVTPVIVLLPVLVILITLINLVIISL